MLSGSSTSSTTSTPPPTGGGQVLWIEVDTSLPALRVIRVLEPLAESRGLPGMIRVDNGPE